MRTLRTMAAEPRVTYALLAVNVMAFLASGQFSIGGGSSAGDSLYRDGALIGSGDPGTVFAGKGVGYDEYWRLLTGGFLHAGFLHIFFNMYLLLFLGRMLEPVLGSVKFAAIYFVSLLAGSCGALLVSPHTPTVGASGAVFGLMGAAALEMRSRGISIQESGLGFLIIVNLVLSFTLSNISWGGHVGGLIGGALATLAIQYADRQRSRALAYAACAVLAVGAVGAALASAQSSKPSTTGTSLTVDPTQQP